MATAVTSLAAARTTTRTSATSSTTIAVAIATAAAGTSFTPALGTRRARFHRRDDSIDAVEVWLIVGVKIRAAFDHRRRRTLRCSLRNDRRRLRRDSGFIHLRRKWCTAHFRALFF